MKEENNLVLKKHRERKQYLILICPEIEMWLMNAAASINIDPVSFDLPKNLEGFKIITKTQNIDKNEGFKRFIKTLVKENAPSITTLKNWIELFKTNQL